MNSKASEPWLELFPPAAPGAPGISLKFHLLRKYGTPLLLIPEDPRLTGDSLALYPAQTVRARLVRSLVALTIRARLPGLTQPLELTTDSQSLFLQFVASPSSPAKPPSFALLFGNPNTSGRRFILLKFDRLGRPDRVIKVGQGAAAVALVRREAEFLIANAAKLSVVPKVLGEFEATNVRAVALEYVPGETPRAEDAAAAGEVLGPWLDREKTVGIVELPAWQRLQTAVGSDELFGLVEKALATVRVHPAVFHGDFAPWNIRANPITRQWTVLDWERGELTGPPAWDWFHFVIQSALLVAKLPAEKIAKQLEIFLRSPGFTSYAERAGIKETVRPLLLGYLLYCRDVLKPSEGRQTANALLELLRRRWQPL